MQPSLETKGDLSPCSATAVPAAAPVLQQVPADGAVSTACKAAQDGLTINDCSSQGMSARLSQDLSKVVATADTHRMPLTSAWATQIESLANEALDRRMVIQENWDTYLP